MATSRRSRSPHARRVARRLYDADALTVVVVGRPEGVSPTRAAPDIRS